MLGGEGYLGGVVMGRIIVIELNVKRPCHRRQRMRSIDDLYGRRRVKSRWGGSDLELRARGGPRGLRVNPNKTGKLRIM